MTLIVALEGKDGLVLAADSRATIGDPRGLTAIVDDQRKIFRLDSYCAIGISGASELAAKLVDSFQEAIKQEGKQNTDEICESIRTKAIQSYSDWFRNFERKERPNVVLTVIGYHTRGVENVPRIYLLASPFDFAPQLAVTGYMLTGVPQYATYLLNRLYDRGMVVDNLAALAIYLISETASQDPKVGGPLYVATIKPSEPYRELGGDEIQSIVGRNEERNKRLREFFREQ